MTKENKEKFCNYIVAAIAAILAYIFVAQICKMNILNLYRPANMFINTVLFAGVTYTGYIYLRNYKIKIEILIFSFLFAVTCLSGFVMRNSEGAGVFERFDAQKGSINEMCSIPSAQIARCCYFKNMEMEPEMLQNIEQLGVTPGDYTLITADIVKGRIQIENQKKHFLMTWWEVFKEYPMVCLDAFLYINQGNLSLDDTTNGYIYGAEPEERMGYLITATAHGFGVEHKSLFPALENIYEELFTINTYQDIPIVSLVFVPAFYFWTLMVGLLHSVITGKKQNFCTFVLLFCYFLTVLLGPCTLIRYSYPLVAGVPVLLALEFGTGGKISLRREE